MKRLTLILICVICSAERGEFLNSTGKDGQFHTRPDMFMCLNFSFDPGPGVRENAHLKADLVFDGYDGASEVSKAVACVPVTQRMIDRQNAILDALDKAAPMKPGESRTLKLK